MKKHIMPLLLILTAFAGPALARLGDTPEQCNQRYGHKYTEKGGDGFWTAERVYEVNGIRLTLRFLPASNGVTQAHYVDYKPIRAKMSEAQIQTLLETVSSKWTPLTEIRDERKDNKPKPAENQVKNFSRSKKGITIESSGDAEQRAKDKEAKFQQELAAKNKLITDMKDRIRSAIEWYDTKTTEKLNYFVIPNDYAGISPQRVVIVSKEYLLLHEKMAETSPGDKKTATPSGNQEFKGF